tara:strand:- start:143 stop:625 length:483 start_codon:yes stop_codon:yes gene_type:complete
MTTKLTHYTKSINLIQHQYGAPWMRIFGLGPSLSPIKAIKQLQTLLNKNTFWARNRSLKHLKKMIAKSSSIVTLWEEKKLIGFGRATSDNIYRAVLWDIVIAEDYQKHGFGKILVDSLQESKSVKNVEKVYLMTTNCQDFYESCGFTSKTNQTVLLKENL